MKPEDFPVLLSIVAGTVDRERRLRDAMATLSGAIAIGAMRKVEHDDLKNVLGSAVAKAFERAIWAPFLPGIRDAQGRPQEAANSLAASINIMSLHDVLSAKRKVDATTATGPIVDALRAFLNEVHPLAVAMSTLKGALVKGRAAPTAEQQLRSQSLRNPDKIMVTCACCFRSIALAGQTMAHHGYTRPESGSQTSSCLGVRFRPLEVACDGLVCILDSEKRLLERLRKSYEHRAEITTLADRRGRSLPPIGPADSQWHLALASYVANLESSIRFTTRRVADLQLRLDAWEPTEPVGLTSVRRGRGRGLVAPRPQLSQATWEQ